MGALSRMCARGIQLEVCGKNLNQNLVEMIIRKGKSSEIKGFASKAGKAFQAF